MGHSLLGRAGSKPGHCRLSPIATDFSGDANFRNVSEAGMS